MSSTIASAVIGVHHGGISVSDMDASLRFYRDGLGLEVTLDAIRDAPYLHETLAVPFTALRYVLLKVPGTDAGAVVELLEYQGAERMPAAARPQDPGNGHLCLQVRDAVALHARLSRDGLPLTLRRRRWPSPPAATLAAASCTSRTPTATGSSSWSAPGRSPDHAFGRTTSLRPSRRTNDRNAAGPSAIG